MRITLITPDISSNAMARMCPIADALREDHTVKIVGFDHGDGFFEPYSGEFEYEVVPAGKTPVSLAKNIHKLERSITGDICYAFRPLIGSLGVGLLHKWREGTPVILDVEDLLRFDEYPIYKKLYNTIRFSGDPTFEGYTPFLRKSTEDIDAVTVTSSYLAEQYGGTVLPYGPDEDEFDPEKVDPYPDLVSRYAENRLIVFVGTIRPHKGLDTLADALPKVPDDVKLVIAGYDPHEIVDDLKIRSEGKVDFLGPIPHTKVPAYLQAASIVVVPQKQTKYTQAQIPNKVFEAMAMGKPIIASATADLPKIIGGCGKIVEPSDPNLLATAINELIGDQSLLEAMGERARERYVEEFSRPVLRAKINEIVEYIH